MARFFVYGLPLKIDFFKKNFKQGIDLGSVPA